MSNPKQGSAYGAATGDTAFRKTWDRADYAERAAAREEEQKKEGRERYEAKLAGKKYHKRAATPPDAKDTEARKARLDVGSLVGKTQIVPAGAAIGKRGRGAGFYCEACDLTYKDNLQYVEHLNSRQHLVATGQTGEVKKATVTEVRERLAWLKRKREESEADGQMVDLGTRLEIAKERDDKEREEKRRRRNERRRKNKDDGEFKQEDNDDGVIR